MTAVPLGIEGVFSPRPFQFAFLDAPARGWAIRHAPAWLEAPAGNSDATRRRTNRVALSPQRRRSGEPAAQRCAQAGFGVGTVGATLGLHRHTLFDWFLHGIWRFYGWHGELFILARFPDAGLGAGASMTFGPSTGSSRFTLVQGASTAPPAPAAVNSILSTSGKLTVAGSY